jgi:four helix bundle protein
MQIKSYKELTAYTKSYELVKSVYKATATFPKEEIYGIVAQMRRSAVSIPSNIAEGYMRGSKEYVQFLRIAIGSCAELETQLSLSKDLGFYPESDFLSVYNLNQEVMKLLNTYISRLTNR